MWCGRGIKKRLIVGVSPDLGTRPVPFSAIVPETLTCVITRGRAAGAVFVATLAVCLSGCSGSDTAISDPLPPDQAETPQIAAPSEAEASQPPSLADSSMAQATDGSGATPPEPTAPQTPIGAVGSCPDPAGMETYDLARLLVVPGFSGDVGWPDFVAPGSAGTIIMKGTGALSAGHYREQLPGDPRPFVSIDFEGGKVARNSELLGKPPSAREQAATMTPAQVRDLAAQTGATLRSYGIDVNYAPVVDLDLGSPIVETRSYGSQAEQVVAYAGAFADGMRDAGVLPVIKHFPGHGSADGDSHLGPVTTDSWDVVRARDVPVFTQLLAQPGGWMVMMGHLNVPGLTADPALPTSLDPAAYQALRAETGFQGPVITDDLATMRAIVDLYSIPQAVVLAVAAGADMALIAESSQYEQAVTDLAVWGDGQPGNRDQLVESARRAQTAMPCGRSG